MGIGLLPEATVARRAPQPSGSAPARQGQRVEQESRRSASRWTRWTALRVDERARAAGASTTIGPWPAHRHRDPRPRPDGIATLLPEEGLLIVGDYLSPLEIPFIYDSAWAYRDTLDRWPG